MVKCARWLLGALGLVSVGAAKEPTLEDWVEQVYRAFQAEQAALSPDGKRLAYTVHDKGRLSVEIVEVDDPSKRIHINVEDDRVQPLTKQPVPVHLQYLQWHSGSLLVLAPRPQLVSYQNAPGLDQERPDWLEPVYAIDADKRSFRQIVDSDDYKVQTIARQRGGNGEEPPDAPTTVTRGRRIRLLGRAADSPLHLLFEASPGPTNVVEVDVATGKQHALSESFAPGSYLYDGQGNARVYLTAAPRVSDRVYEVRSSSLLKAWKPLVEAGGPPDEFRATTRNTYDRRSIPLAVDPSGSSLYFSSNVGRDTVGIYELDLATGRRSPLALENPHFDLTPSALVFDYPRHAFVGARVNGLVPFTLWVDHTLKLVQQALDAKFPNRIVEILQWDDARSRFLLKVTGSDPGRIFIYDRGTDLLTEFRRLAPWLKPEDLCAEEPIEFDTPAGVHLTGYLTYPRKSRVSPPPLAIVFPSGFLQRVSAGFDRDAQIYAKMGFVVLRLNARGTSGFGIAHRDAALPGVDRIPVEDAVAAIDWLAGRRPIDTHRVVTVGSDFGGFLALRALELDPERFRCAVAVNAPVDLNRWLQGSLTNFNQSAMRQWLERGKTPVGDLSVIAHADQLEAPVMLLRARTGNLEIDRENDLLEAKLKHLARPPEYVELPVDYALGLAGARGAAFRQIESFLNANLYDFKVKIGPLKEVQ